MSNDYNAKEPFKRHVEKIKPYLEKDKDILVITESDKGLSYFMGKLNSDSIDKDINLGELIDAGVYLDTDGYHTMSRNFTAPSHDWQKNKGKLFVSLDALIRHDNNNNSTTIRSGVDVDTELELSGIEKPY